MSLIELFKQKETSAYPFKPNNGFYTELGISKKRFAMICKNKSIATHEELSKVATYLKLPLEKLI